MEAATWLLAVVLLDEFEELLWGRTVTEGPRPLYEADRALLVDHDRDRAVADFDVDPHSECGAIGRTDRLRRIEEQGEREGVGGQSGVLEERFRGPLVVRVDAEDHRVRFREVVSLISQLRELSVADRSGVAVDEGENDGFLAAVLFEFNRFAGCGFQ